MAEDLAALLDPSHPKVSKYREQAPELLAVAQSLTITTDADLEVAAEYTQTSSAACRAIKALFKPSKDALNEAKRQISSIESALLSGFERADTILRGKVTAYRSEQVRRAVEERRQREREERKRREDEQLAQAARLELLARKTGEEHYQRAADFVLEQPVRAVVPETKPVTPKGISFRDETGIDVVDFDALIAAVAAKTVDRRALMPNHTWLKTEAKQNGALQDGDELFPGVVVTKTPDVTVRTR